MTAVGEQLPELVIEASVRNIVATAIASRDYQDVHHDVALAQQRGSKTIFTNILTSNGYVLKYVTDWAGTGARVRGVAVRLGTPCYANDTLTFTGRAAQDAHGERVATVSGSTEAVRCVR